MSPKSKPSAAFTLMALFVMSVHNRVLESNESLERRVTELQALVAASSPVGSVAAFAGPPDQIPAGWRLCDGQVIRDIDEPTLLRAIGRSWGGGKFVDSDDSYFAIPDLRGHFLRGLDDPDDLAQRSLVDVDVAQREQSGPGTSSGPRIGSFQRDALRGHCGGDTRPKNCAVHWIVRMR